MIIPRTSYSQGIKSTLIQTPLPTLSEITASFPRTPSTAAYIILSDGDRTTVIEKDRVSARIRSSTTFIAATNHDAGSEAEPGTPTPKAAVPDQMREIVSESQERKGCLEETWRRATRRYLRRHPDESEDDVAVCESNVVKWMQRYPIANECTHYAVVMDPKRGAVAWVRRWLEPAFSYH